MGERQRSRADNSLEEPGCEGKEREESRIPFLKKKIFFNFKFYIFYCIFSIAIFLCYTHYYYCYFLDKRLTLLTGEGLREGTMKESGERKEK